MHVYFVNSLLYLEVYYSNNIVPKAIAIVMRLGNGRVKRKLFKLIILSRDGQCQKVKPGRLMYSGQP